VSNPARKKGTTFEVWLLEHLRRLFGPNVHRAPLRGIRDEGDYVGVPWPHEAKNVATPRFPDWIRRLRVKAGPGQPWALIWKGDMRSESGQPVVVIPLSLYEELVDAQHNPLCGDA
jgi:hypothetical protein